MQFITDKKQNVKNQQHFFDLQFISFATILCSTHSFYRLTHDVDSHVNIVQLQSGEGDFNPSSLLRLAYSTGLGHEALATMVNVDFTISALVTLLVHPIQETATVVTPRGRMVRGGTELMRAWLLEKRVGQNKHY